VVQSSEGGEAVSFVQAMDAQLDMLTASGIAAYNTSLFLAVLIYDLRAHSVSASF
jgi:hypothetical protein